MGRSGNEHRWQWLPVVLPCRNFLRNWHNILKDDCRNILSDFKTIDSGDLEFYFSKIDVQFFVELFFCCSPVDCLHSHFIVLLCAFGNGVGMAVTQWESHGNGNWLHGNGRKRKCKNPSPVISTYFISPSFSDGSRVSCKMLGEMWGPFAMFLLGWTVQSLLNPTRAL